MSYNLEQVIREFCNLSEEDRFFNLYPNERYCSKVIKYALKDHRQQVRDQGFYACINTRPNVVLGVRLYPDYLVLQVINSWGARPERIIVSGDTLQVEPGFTQVPAVLLKGSPADAYRCSNEFNPTPDNSTIILLDKQAQVYTTTPDNFEQTQSIFMAPMDLSDMGLHELTSVICTMLYQYRPDYLDLAQPELSLGITGSISGLVSDLINIQMALIHSDCRFVPYSLEIGPGYNSIQVENDAKSIIGYRAEYLLRKTPLFSSNRYELILNIYRPRTWKQLDIVGRVAARSRLQELGIDIYRNILLD